MITKLSVVTILVRDQNEALKWYTEKLGFEKRTWQPKHGQLLRPLVIITSESEVDVS